MAEDLLEDRVKRVEETFGKLVRLPDRMDGLGLRMDGLDRRMDGLDRRLQGVEGRVGQVEWQIVQLRTDMGDGFSAVLEVIDSSSKATQALYDDGRREVRDLFGDLKNEVRATRTQMLALHEDLVERIKSLRG